MPDQDVLGTDHAMPWEKGSQSKTETAMERLSAALDSEEKTEGVDEPAAPKAPKAERAEPEEEAPEEGPDDESEEEFEDDEDPDGDEEEAEAEPVYRVKVDGKEVEVSLRELQDGYSRTSDYTRKTQALAEERRKIEAEAVVIRGARDQYAERLESVALALKNMQPTEPDWAKLKAENPTEYVVQREEWRSLKEQQATVEAEQRKVYEERRADWERQQEVALKAEQERLLEKLPEWRDQAVATAEKQKLVDYVLASGWTNDDLANVTDHRLMLALRKAMLWDESQTNGAAKIREKVRPTKLAQPGTPDRAPSRGKRKVEAKRARELARRTGSVEDVARYLDLTTND